MSYTPDRFWWATKGIRAAELMTEHITALRSVSRHNQSGRHQELAVYRSTYLDYPAPDFDSTGIGREERSPYNLTQGAVDSIHAKIVTNRIRPQIAPVGGRWKHLRKSKLLQRWIDGEYERLDAYAMMSDMVHDALIYGTGWIKVYGYYGRVKLDRVWDGDIYIDPREERFGRIQTLYHVSAVDRQTLIDKYPKHKKALQNAPAAPIDDAMPFGDLDVKGLVGSVDLVTVAEGWRLGIHEDDPGMRMAICNTAVLEREEWEYKDFPFVRYRWGRDPERVRGQGLVERGLGVQHDLDEHTTVVQDSYETFVPKYALPAAANVSISKINDEVGQGITYEGAQPPTVLSSGAIAPDFLTREDMLAARYFRVTGVGEAEATSQTPDNLESGKAIQTHQDVTSLRFLVQGRAYEEACVALANMVLHCAEQLDNPQKVYGSAGEELVSFREAKMAGDQYTIRVFPASKLPDSIAGRLDHIAQLVQLGVVADPDELRQLLDMPDLEGYQDRESAEREWADREIDRCLDGIQGQPSTYMNLPYAIDKARKEHALAMLAGAEDDDPEAMEMLRKFIGAAEAMLQAQQAPPPDAGLAPLGGVPQAPPPPGGMPPGLPPEPPSPLTAVP